jgi:hypothetical protein
MLGVRARRCKRQVLNSLSTKPLRLTRFALDRRLKKLTED